MKLLLDTHIWIWSVLEPSKLRDRVVTDFAKSNCRSGRFQPLSSSPAPTHT